MCKKYNCIFQAKFMKVNYQQLPKIGVNIILAFNQATGMTKISRGVFSKIFGPGGGILPEVSNFDRKSRFLALLSHN